MNKYELIGKFKSKRDPNVQYEAKRNVATGAVSCNCPGWIFYRKCKHVEYVNRSPGFIEITDIPTCAEAQKMDFGRNKEKSEKWFEKHIKIIEL